MNLLAYLPPNLLRMSQATPLASPFPGPLPAAPRAPAWSLREVWVRWASIIGLTSFFVLVQTDWHHVSRWQVWGQGGTAKVNPACPVGRPGDIAANG
jgi:hypothetical protein